MARVAVIGGGLAGLSGAHTLRKAGHAPVVFEANDYPGGRVKSVRKGDFIIDKGAIAPMGGFASVVKLIEEAGLDGALNRYPLSVSMYRDGREYLVDPKRPLAALTSGYLSPLAKFKLLGLLSQVFKNRGNLDFDFPDKARGIDTESIQDYSLRELGEENFDYLSGALIRGTQLANPSETSMALLLWSLKHFTKPFFWGLNSGMQSLPDTLAEQLETRLDCRVTSLSNTTRGVALSWMKGDTEHTEEFDACLVATTADQILAMCDFLDKEKRDFFSSVRYAPSLTVQLGLAERPASRALITLIPEKEHPSLCAIYADHLKARNRAPDDKGLISVTCLDSWSASRLEDSDEAIVNEILDTITPFYGDWHGKIEEFEVSRWSKGGICVDPGHFRRVAQYRAAINPCDRIQFAGDFEEMSTTDAAVRSGTRNAGHLVDMLAEGRV